MESTYNYLNAIFFSIAELSTNTLITLAPITFVLVCITLIICNCNKKTHKTKIKKAEFIINRIQNFNEKQKLAYLRKVDPYAFEELILTCLERKGYPIIRNERYSGDGGVDGRVFINNELTLIQTKRYTGDIRYSHLEEFSELLKNENRHGLFIHTGKTPRKIHGRKIDLTRITIISGSRLINLINTDIKNVI